MVASSVIKISYLWLAGYVPHCYIL